MPLGTISTTTLAFASFMERSVEDGNESSTGSGTAVLVVDNLSKSSTGHRSRPFVPATIFEAWSPLPPVQEPVQPAPPVVPETLLSQLKRTVSTLTKKPISVEKFTNRLMMLGFPAFVIESILQKMLLISESNGKRLVVRKNMEQFIRLLVLVKNKVDLIEAILKQLHEGSLITWSAFLNPTHKSFFRNGLSKKEKADTFTLLSILGFVDPHTNNKLILPSEWASLSIGDTREMLWKVVSESETITGPPPPKGKKRARDQQNEVSGSNSVVIESTKQNVLESETITGPPPPKGKKRARDQQNEVSGSNSVVIESTKQNVLESETITGPPPPKGKKRARDQQNEELSIAKKQKVFSHKEIMKIVLAKLMLFLLGTHGVRTLSMNTFFELAFLDLEQEKLRQMMEFLSDPKNVWILSRFLMEIQKLDVSFSEEDITLKLGEEFRFKPFFVLDSIVEDYDRFSFEYDVHHNDAVQICDEKRRRRNNDKPVDENERFISILHCLWKTKDMKSFLNALRTLRPEFDSNKTTCWVVLEKVVKDFLFTIFNATTRRYHNGEPCANPLEIFLQEVISRGVFKFHK